MTMVHVPMICGSSSPFCVRACIYIVRCVCACTYAVVYVLTMYPVCVHVCVCVCVCCVRLLKHNACLQQQTHLSYAQPLLHLCRLSHTHAYPLLISLRLRDSTSNTQTISTSGLVAWKVWVCRRSSTRLLLTAMTGRTCQKSFTAFMH